MTGRGNPPSSFAERKSSPKDSDMNRTLLKKSLLPLALAILAGFVLWPHLRAQGAKKPPLIILGFDGADYHITEKLIKEGRLPHLAQLAQQGSFRPLTVTNPPQTPVSWSSFATGMNPGRTEIFDFLKREGGTYHPAFALNEEIEKPFNEIAPFNVRLWAVVLAVLLAAIFGHLLRKKLGTGKAVGV